ncbi:MAG: MerR family transcriptional regulator [bacterium]
MSSEELFFRRGELCKVVGLTPRQVQYWDKTGLLRPSYRSKGGHGRFSFQDLIAFKTAKRLLDAGVPLQRVRRSIGSLQQILPSIKRPLVDLTLVATGELILVFHKGTAFEAISGQEWIIPVAEIEREALRCKRPARKVPSGRRLTLVPESRKGFLKSI